MSLGETLIVTFFGFVLTSVAGTLISYFWQSQSWKHQQDYARRRDRIEKQIAIAEELSNLIGRRSFRTFRVVAALRSGEADRIDRSWKDYDNIVIEWNDQINGYITKLRQFFNKRLQYDLDLYITPHFQESGSFIERARRMHNNGNREEDFRSLLSRVSISLNYFSGQSNEFVGGLWRHIEESQDRMDSKVSISFENSGQLSSFYLLKRLFTQRV